jgi:diguanylate cyclase (GGDEF)-like protein
MSVRIRALALAMGGALAVVYLAAEGTSATREVSWSLFVLWAVTCLIAGIRAYRPRRSMPWRWLAVSVATIGFGDVVNSMSRLGGADPPAWAGLLQVVGYVLLGVACLRFVRARFPEGDRDGGLDSTLVVVAVAAVVYEVLSRFTANADYGALEATRTGVFLVIVSWAAACAVRLALASRHMPATWLLLGAAAAGVAGNVLWLALETLGLFYPGHPISVLYVAAYGGVAAAAMHPSMVEMVEPTAAAQRLTGARILLVACAVLVVPATLYYSSLRSTAAGITALAACLVVSGLAVIRFSLLVRDREHREERLHQLSERQALIGDICERALAGERFHALLASALPGVPGLIGVGQDEVRYVHAGGPVDDGAHAWPLGERDEPVGLLVVDGDLAAEELAFGRALSGALSTALQRERNEERVRHQAAHDVLTGLPNRATLEGELRTRLARTRHPFAVLFIDLDGFKDINDSYGHHVGDDVLVAVASTLAGTLRAGDLLARFAGDEFVALIERVTEEDATSLADRLLEALSVPLALQGQELEIAIGASVGVVMAQPGEDEAGVLQRADAAMYAAKEGGKARIASYDPVDAGRRSEERRLEERLRGAVRRGELRLVYQPLFELRADRDPMLVGAEALLRWAPDGEEISPARFIPLAERGGQILAIGAWVIEQACTQLAAWQADLDPSTPFTVSINLSPRQLVDPELVALVRAALASTGADPARLCVELTEHAIISDVVRVRTTLDQLRALGIQVALDDFGTGYSSLSHVRDLSLDLLKIDRSFLSGLCDRESDAAIARALCDMAVALGVQVVAEGVETPQQLAAVGGLGCQLVQGFLLGRPMPPDELVVPPPGPLERTRPTGVGVQHHESVDA